MRTLSIALAIVAALFGLAGASNKMVTVASANFEPHERGDLWSS